MQMRQPTPRSVIPYIGGKHQLVRQLVPLIEYTAVLGCTEMYELYGGGGRIIFLRHCGIIDFNLK